MDDIKGFLLRTRITRGDGDVEDVELDTFSRFHILDTMGALCIGAASESSKMFGISFLEGRSSETATTRWLRLPYTLICLVRAPSMDRVCGGPDLRW